MLRPSNQFKYGNAEQRFTAEYDMTPLVITENICLCSGLTDISREDDVQDDTTGWEKVQSADVIG